VLNYINQYTEPGKLHIARYVCLRLF